MDVSSMRTRRGTIHEEAEGLLNSARVANRRLSGPEQVRFDALLREQNELADTIDRAERNNSIGMELSTSQGRQTRSVLATSSSYMDADRSLALRAWALGPSRASVEMLRAADRIGLRAESRELGADEQRALSTGTTDAGGYAVTSEPMRFFWDVQKQIGSVRNVATVIRTSTGANLPIPVPNDTANVGEIVAEAGAVTTTADPTFGIVNLGTFKYSSKAVIVSVELLQDSFINLPQYLGAKLGERIARIQNLHFTVGAGTTEPFGIAVQASLGKTAAATNAITWDEVFDLQSSVDPAYSNRSTAGFMMHPSTAAYLRKLKVGGATGEYVWQSDIQGSSPAQGNSRNVAGRILGYPVYLNPDLSSTFSTANRLVLFGDLGAYCVRDAGEVIFARADELRILNHQVVFLAFQRSSGALLESGAVKYLRTA